MTDRNSERMLSEVSPPHSVQLSLIVEVLPLDATVYAVKREDERCQLNGLIRSGTDLKIGEEKTPSTRGGSLS